ncbi:unnamed protein product [Cylicocyclus nassatus]|uniref:Uncharacterized protein n=1 Tax=Cylicocyclus nassatus TaxID=53992 RepID=A0AA36H2L7_CYLNA|nr:unnamed protein product [Cylicocyclus nassatus]
MGDVVAVILRVITKFVPILVLRNHTGVIQVDRDSFPLATLTNAAEWYTNYVIILSALVFGADRAVMAVSIKSYAWADSIYDAIDMLFETLFYVPVLCMLNGFTMIMLYSQYNTIKKRHDLKFNLEQYRLPTVEEVYIRCGGPGPVAFLSSKQEKEKREHRMLQRLDVELSFAMIAIIDQQIDFFAVLFYTLYWAGYSHFIDIDGTIFLESYSILFEFGNIISPYILLCFFPDIRREVFRHIRPHCRSHEDDVEEG